MVLVLTCSQVKSSGYIGYARQLAYSEHTGFITQTLVIFFILLKLVEKRNTSVFFQKFIGNLSQTYVSNKAVDKFFNVLERSKSINWHFFDTAVNNLDSK